MKIKVIDILVFLSLVFSLVTGHIDFKIPNEAIDNSLYEEVLDEELCAQQISFIRQNPLLAINFADAGIRIPRGILQGNTLDMGNYHQCINLNQPLGDSEIQGKYCSIHVSLSQNIGLTEILKLSQFLPVINEGESIRLENETITLLEKHNAIKRRMEIFTGVLEDKRISSDYSESDVQLTLAVCIPKPCTTQQVFDSLLFNISALGLQYSDAYCRLPNDKPWVPADYVAIVVFSLLALITLVSTTYDLWHTFIKKTDPKQVNVIGKSFSVYTNGRRLMTFNSGPDTVECIDGIRALAMAWVIIGHTFSTEPFWVNLLDTYMWITSWKALWLLGGTYTVDTFFTLSGFLIVYTTVGKLTRKKLFKNLHLFYLNRLLRMFPLLATVVLLEASFLNRLTDGPDWTAITSQVNRCRATWWSTLLHIQNYMNPIMTCVGQTWYLAIDVQLHILSPLILFWLLGSNKKIGWSALAIGFFGVLAAATAFNFVQNFPPNSFVGTQQEILNYQVNYYMNTLTRASPFFVGMAYGYRVRETRKKLPGVQVVLFWISFFALMTFLIYTNYPINQVTWDNQLLSNLYNSFARTFWAIAVGGLIYACISGFAGPINWFLSLRIWKIHSRLSYAMYLFHYMLMVAMNSTIVAPLYFSVSSTVNLQIFGTLLFLNGSVIPDDDNSLYEEVLDEELCAQQISFIRQNPLLAINFADAGIRIPRGILQGNTLDMGNYHQCINLNQPLGDSEIQGKYCSIHVSLSQNIGLTEILKLSQFLPVINEGESIRLENETITLLEKHNAIKRRMEIFTGVLEDKRISSDYSESDVQLTLAVCIPKPCTTQQVFDSLLFNISALGLQYSDAYCRLPNDKPWVPADYVAIVVFSLLALITLVSTTYDLWHAFIKKTDPKQVNVIGKSFSVYTNGRRLMTFNSGPDTVECIDGIRALAMAWVIIGHTFSTEPFWVNLLDTYMWITSWKALWLLGGTYTVDTFFTLSGFLIVYTTVGKLTRKKLFKNLHLFYLNRLLRMFPLLATVVLLEASFLNRLTDGPDWTAITSQVNRCRATWWSTLLHIQNYMNPIMTCVGQTWYLAIDVQLHILSPLILFWLLGSNKKIGWSALAIGFFGVLAAATAFNFVQNFPPNSFVGTQQEILNYQVNYYMNTLTRASPFFVGMAYGYRVRETRKKLPGVQVVLFWISFFALMTFLIYTNYPINQVTWDNQLLSNLYNSFARTFWAIAVGGLIYACISGFAGPINWFLSLRIWKIHSRLSYAMYLFHYMLMVAMNSTIVAPLYFSVGSTIFKFLAHYFFSMAVSFLMMLVIDAPFSTLFKLLLGGRTKKSTN